MSGGVDFSGLVLAPNMLIFGKSVTVTPKKSSPNMAPFPATGIWTVESVNIPMDDGSVLSSRSLKFGIRMADFPVALKQGDWISTAVTDLPLGYWQGDFDPAAMLDLEIVDTGPDGQGGSTLTMKRVSR